MYIRLSENESKSNYKRLLAETISLVYNSLKATPSDPFYNNILMQILDIQENIVDKGLVFDEEFINQRYTLGAIAVKNFEEEDEMYQRLCDVFGGAIDYANFVN